MRTRKSSEVRYRIALGSSFILRSERYKRSYEGERTGLFEQSLYRLPLLRMSWRKKVTCVKPYALLSYSSASLGIVLYKAQLTAQWFGSIVNQRSLNTYRRNQSISFHWWHTRCKSRNPQRHYSCPSALGFIYNCTPCTIRLLKTQLHIELHPEPRSPL